MSIGAALVHVPGPRGPIEGCLVPVVCAFIPPSVINAAMLAASSTPATARRSSLPFITRLLFRVAGCRVQVLSIQPATCNLQLVRPWPCCWLEVGLAAGPARSWYYIIYRGV